MTENVAEKQGTDNILMKEGLTKSPDQKDQPREADWKDTRSADSSDSRKNQGERREVGVAAVDEYPEAVSSHLGAQKQTQ